MKSWGGGEKNRKELNCQTGKESDQLEKRKNYNYLGVLEADTIKQRRKKK